MNRSFNKTIIFWAAANLLLFSSGCVLLGPDEEPIRKNADIQFESPAEPFVRIETTNADAAWKNKATGNTIAVNSTCTKDLKKDLKDLEKNILSGIDNLSIDSEAPTKIDGMDARRVLVEGKTEGIAIKTDLITMKKGNCTYDLSHIGRKKSFEEDSPAFEKFILRFHVP